jgi:hypothetical protein
MGRGRPKTKTEDTRINVRVWSPNYDRLHCYCKENGITVTTAINMCIENILEQAETKTEQQMYRDWLKDQAESKV